MLLKINKLQEYQLLRFMHANKLRNHDEYISAQYHIYMSKEWNLKANTERLTQKICKRIFIISNDSIMEPFVWEAIKPSHIHLDMKTFKGRHCFNQIISNILHKHNGKD